MSVIPIEVAMQHLYADEADKDQVQRKLDSAIASAEQFMNRRIYATLEAWYQAKIDAEAVLNSTEQILKDVLAGVYHPKLAELKVQQADYDSTNAGMAILGIIINPAIEIGILLILGDLYKNRENTVEGTVAELPMAAKHHLQPFRIMGI